MSSVMLQQILNGMYDIYEWIINPHMSAEPKWCFSNYPKGGTNIFQLRTTYQLRGSNQTHLLFGTFALKMGKNNLKMGLKCLGLVW